MLTMRGSQLQLELALGLRGRLLALLGQEEKVELMVVMMPLEAALRSCWALPLKQLYFVLTLALVVGLGSGLSQASSRLPSCLDRPTRAPTVGPDAQSRWMVRMRSRMVKMCVPARAATVGGTRVMK